MATLTEIITTAQDFTGVVTERVVIPLMILFVGIMVGKLAGNLLMRLGKSIDLNKQARMTFRQNVAMIELLAGGFSAVIYTVSVVWALYAAGILTYSFLVVAGTLLVLGLLALYVWARDFLPNVFAIGKARKRCPPGRQVRVGNVSGTVERVGLTFTRLRDDRGVLILVPNRTVARR